MEAISSQQLTEKFNKIHVTTSLKDKSIFITNLQENISIFYQISNTQKIVNKLISLPTDPPTPDRIDDVVKSPLKSEWCDSIFENDEKMAKSTTSIALLKRSLLSPGTKILRPSISFRVKTT